MSPPAQPEADLSALAEAAQAFGVMLDAAQVAAFARFRALLLEWNQRFNLTAISDPTAVLTRHFLDSLSAAYAIPAERRVHPTALVDVGSGAGFPGLPLAIAFPHWRITLLEATGKKVTFLEHVAHELGLANVRAIHARAEQLAHVPSERGRYDFVTARALAALPTLLEYCQPFARVGGLTIALKKGDLAVEVEHGRSAAATLGGILQKPIAITAPGLEDGRVLLLVQQTRLCPESYPRPAGAPVKRPLGLHS